MFKIRALPRPRSLTVFGRSLLLVSLEVAANAICLAVAARSHQILGLAILAWTIGLRHALDADHIRSIDEPFAFSASAIDNATRTLIGHGRLVITCGLFFSLGHSTIVIAVNTAIVISTSVYDKLNGVGNVGSIIGTAISGSFLFIVGLANSFILCKVLRQRRQRRRKRNAEHGETVSEPAQNENMLMMRLLGPLVNFVNRPWKMYPVGVLFGLGFDTASSIALLSISALAKDGANNTRVPPSDVIILPLLFTAGMTLVDSLDSILMLYSYTRFAAHTWRIFETTNSPLGTSESRSVNAHHELSSSTEERTREGRSVAVAEADNVSPINQACSETGRKTPETRHDKDDDVTMQESDDRAILAKRSTMSELSILLTILSILLAFTISLIEIMGLIGDNCGKCQAAASDPDGGGPSGTWWRGWAQANENSGYIGAGTVGVFVIVVVSWYMMRRICRWS